MARELDERLGFGALIAQHVTDSRRGKNTQFPLADLFGQSIYSRIAGYEDVNDAERLVARSDLPADRVREDIRERGAALTSRLQSFETEMLAEEENFGSLARMNRELIARVEAIDSPQRVVLDMDSTEIPVYGQQENSAYNGHFASTCYHPLLLFNREGDCLAAKLRPWQCPQRRRVGGTTVAGDRAAAEAGQGGGCSVPTPPLPSRRFYGSVGGAGCEVRHLPSGQRQPGAGHGRAVARGLQEGLATGRWSVRRASLYEAASWKTARRVVAKVEHLLQGELFSREWASS